MIIPIPANSLASWQQNTPTESNGSQHTPQALSGTPETQSYYIPEGYNSAAAATYYDDQQAQTYDSQRMQGDRDNIPASEKPRNIEIDTTKTQITPNPTEKDIYIYGITQVEKEQMQMLS